VWAGRVVAAARAKPREASAADRAVHVVSLFSTGMAESQRDVRALLVWQPLAKTARQLWPEAFAALDGAAGATFPFSSEQLQDAHARWTAEWLAWERTHDADYKLKAALLEHEYPGGGDVLRARLDGVEREKIDLYQRRY